MANGGRIIWREVFKKFQASLRGFKEVEGKVIGSDPYGNKYFEIAADPQRGKRRPTRWYRAPDTEAKEIIGVDLYGGFDAKMPAEWESWLRHRRDEPPTDEQVRRSLALSELKKMNAAKLEMDRIEELKADGRYDGPETKPMDHEKAFYPKYDDYEVNPGNSEKRKDPWASYKNPYLPDDHQHTRKK